MKVMHGDLVEARVGALGVKIDELEHRMTDCFKHVDERFEAVDKRFEQVDKRFEQVDKRFEAVDKRFENLELDLRELGRDTKRGFDMVAERIDKTNRAIMFGALTMTGGFMAGFAAMIALVLNQT
jgi:archaellum component FlaC